MKSTFRIIIYTLLVTFISCDNYESSYLLRNKLKGKIRSLTQITYEAVSKFGEIEKGMIYHDYIYILLKDYR